MLLGRFFWRRFRTTGDPRHRAAAGQRFTRCLPTIEFDDIPQPLISEVAALGTARASGLLDRALGVGDRAGLEVAAATLSKVCVLEAPPPERAQRYSRLALALLTRFSWLGDSADLTAAGEAAEAAVAIVPPDHVDRAVHLTRLGEVWFLRSTLDSSDPAAAEAAMRWHTEAVRAAATDHPDYADILSGLAAAHSARYLHSAAPADVEEAVRLFRAALTYAAEGGYVWTTLTASLSGVLVLRGLISGQSEDFAEAVRLSHLAVDATPPKHPDRGVRLFALGVALLHRDEAGDLDRTIETLRVAAAAYPRDHWTRAAILPTLADALATRFENQGVLADSAAAISVEREQLELLSAADPGRAALLAQLGVSIRQLFEFSGRTSDLDESIAMLRSALEMTSRSDPDWADYASTLGTGLWWRFEHSGDHAALSEAVRYTRAAVAATPAEHELRALRLSNLGVTLLSRFEHFGATGDLDDALDALRVGSEQIDADPHVRALCQQNLCTGLHSRFVRRGDAADLAEAVEVGRAAVAATGPGSPHLAKRSSTLGIALEALYNEDGDPQLLDEAVACCRAAVESTPKANPDRAGYLSNLGTILMTRFETTEDDDDRFAALQATVEAVTATERGHPGRAMRLSNMGLAFLRSNTEDDPDSDFDLVVDCFAEAVRECPPQNFLRARYSCNLIQALQARFQQTGLEADLDTALATADAAADDEWSAPQDRMDAALVAGWWLLDLRSNAAIGLLEKAVGLMPLVASRHLTRGNRQQLLRAHAELARDTAALILREGGPTAAARAIQVLETGRSVVWGQAMETRTDRTELWARAPALADRFEVTSAGLETGLHTDTRHRAVEEFHRVVTEIRALPGFSDFLRHSDIAVLREQSRAGPIVLLNISEFGSHALVVRADGVTGIPLRQVEQAALEELVTEFHAAIAVIMDPNSVRAERAEAARSVREQLTWLWRRIVGLVLAELKYLNEPNPPQWPRVWWIPTGPLSAFPLQAAGDYQTAHGRTAMDFVISSYAPSIRHLRYARAHTPGTGEFRVAAVAMPQTPARTEPDGTATRFGRLHNAEWEISSIEQQYPRSIDPRNRFIGAQATMDSVAAALDRCEIAHFACHAEGHPTDPAQSRILLHDHNENPLTLTRMATMRLPRAQLAFLSACRTAHSLVPEFFDESLNLATACMVGGYPRVVATQWPVPDAISYEIAVRFYRHLQEAGGNLDPEYAAQALHRVVNDMRDQPGLRKSPHLWGAWIHVGI
ncbi:CHAT domain-containing protein [Nocardia sp. NPDC051832]|uniref:CHAT domain-containing protein n=1 Tax=Nocardia sp. NPDC051832 TaxID=3155673 RepID=UPI003440A4ED